MPDLKQRLHKDMLVVSSPLDADLAAQGIDVDAEGAMLAATDEESAADALRLQKTAGVQCLVTPTRAITAARLAHARLEASQHDLAQQALDMVRDLAPQHVLALVGSTGLPIDPESRSSLVENRDQYSEAVRAFGDDVDAFFLDGLDGVDDVRCALMGARRVSDAPVVCSVDVDGKGGLRGHADQTLVEAVELMEDLQADVVGFRTSAGPDEASELVRRVARATPLPVLVQIDVDPVDKRRAMVDPHAADGNPYPDADAMIPAALRLRAAGANMLRATGRATAVYAGALAAAVADTDAVR